MSGDVKRIKYESAANMVKTFQQGVEQLQDTMSVIQSIASELEGGALLGEGGEALTNALRSTFARSLTKLTEKFDELAQDVTGAMEDFQQADTESAGLF